MRVAAFSSGSFPLKSIKERVSLWLHGECDYALSLPLTLQGHRPGSWQIPWPSGSRIKGREVRLLMTTDVTNLLILTMGSNTAKTLSIPNYRRGHTYRLLLGPSRLRHRSGAFSVRVVKYWNRLPSHLDLSTSASIFKKQLDRQWSEIFPAAPV